jgi:flagellar hook-associated protein 3
MGEVQNKIITQKKVNKPSDSPLGSGKIINFNERLTSISSFQKNIENGLAFTNYSVSALEGIHEQTHSMLVDVVSLKNPTNSTSTQDYVQKLTNYLDTIVNLANSEFQGQYLFAGTDYSVKPYEISADGQSVVINSSNLGGEKSIKTSNNTLQKINITGEELFNSAIKYTGNFNSADAVGTAKTFSQKIFDGDGNEFTIEMEFTKSAANTYTLNTGVKDSTDNVVYSGTNSLGFNPATGKITGLDGTTAQKLQVSVPGKNLDFTFDVSGLMESNKATTVNSSMNLNGNIFNTIISIRENLKNGNMPNDNQLDLLNGFSQHFLNKVSELGNIQNNLTSASELLSREETEVTSLLSQENDVDMAEYAIELQNYQNALEVSYKISSIMLPKSLLDYI